MTIVVDLAADVILFGIQNSLFSSRDVPVVVSSVEIFLPENAAILCVKLTRLGRVRLTVSDSGTNPPILISEARVDLGTSRMAALPGAGDARAGSHRHAYENSSERIHLNVKLFMISLPKLVVTYRDRLQLRRSGRAFVYRQAIELRANAIIHPERHRKIAD